MMYNFINLFQKAQLGDYKTHHLKELQILNKKVLVVH